MNKKILRLLFITLTLTSNKKLTPASKALLVYDAISTGDAIALRTLLQANREYLSTTNYRGWNLLHETVRYGYPINIITELLSLGIDKKAKTPAGNTALHLAAMEGRKDHLSMLLQHQADVTTKNKRGQTPLHLAAEHGYVECITLLLLYDADTEARDKDGHTPLLWATHNKHDDCAAALRQHHAH